MYRNIFVDYENTVLLKYYLIFCFLLCYLFLFSARQLLWLNVNLHIEYVKGLRSLLFWGMKHQWINSIPVYMPTVNS